MHRKWDMHEWTKHSLTCSVQHTTYTDSTNVYVYCAHAAGVSREVTKCNKQAANNVGQPCPLLLHQVCRIGRGTVPWTTGPLGLPSARLCIHHHQNQIDGPPSWGQGTQQQEDGLPQRMHEKHCVLPALNNRNRLTTDVCTHECKFWEKNKLEGTKSEVAYDIRMLWHLTCLHQTLHRGTTSILPYAIHCHVCTCTEGYVHKWWLTVCNTIQTSDVVQNV